MSDAESPSERRRFLKGSILLGAAGAAGAVSGIQAHSNAVSQQAQPGGAKPPTAERTQAESGHVPAADGHHVSDPGSDFMVDVLKAAGIDYVAAMVGSTFRGLQESILNYGGNRKPEWIVCVHEEISAAMAHGYAKVAGKPMACLVHSNVGLLHASMAIYNAWADRAPIIVLAANALDASTRRLGVEWLHSHADVGAIVRDFVKWDDIPISLQHYSESFMRCYEAAMTPPYEPTLLVVDAELQEEAIEDRGVLSIPKRAPVSPSAAQPSAVDEVASLLVHARSPVIAADRAARTASGVKRLVELAELLQAPVVDLANRMNMPTNHYLNHSFRERALVSQADVILGLELTDIFGLVNTVRDLPHREARSIIKAGTKVVGISAKYGFMKGNVQDAQRYYAADLAIDADAEACLPQIIDAVRARLTPDLASVVAGREAGLRAAFAEMRAAAAREAARDWDASPIGTGRLCMELWDQIKDLNWSLVSGTRGVSMWPHRLWDITEHHQFIGYSGAHGIGYGAPAAAGAALANRDAGRISIAIQSDGDLMFLPGVLWTMAHHSLPLLMVMHNNRAWHQETMHLQLMASRRDRGVEDAQVGTLITDPAIDFATMAKSMGVWAEGPISDPAKLRAALARALAVVKGGRPALLDVVTQPR